MTTPDRSRESIHEAYERVGARRFSAREAIVCIFVAALLLAAFEGPSIRRAGERMDPGVQRSMVLAVGHPAGWIGDRMGLARISHEATSWLSPDTTLSNAAGFAAAPAHAAGGQLPAVTPDSFDPVTLGGKALPHRPLRTVLVTGDSMGTPLDSEGARRLAA